LRNFTRASIGAYDVSDYLAPAGAARVPSTAGFDCGVAASRRILQAFETVLAGLRDVPHKSSLRDDLAPGLRSIPAAGKGVVSFVVDDAAQMVTVVAITYAGQNWMGRLRERS
jgi:toxin ParE1/3/4